MDQGFLPLAGRSAAIGRTPLRAGGPRKAVRRIGGAILTAAILVAGGQGGAGHSVGHYPSFYPHEIRIEALDPETAGKRLLDKTLHAYINGSPDLPGSIPDHIRSVDSLGSFLVLTFKERSAAAGNARCAAARAFLAAVREEKSGGFVFHPHPITPYHTDYLHHLDRVEAMQAAGRNETLRAPALNIGARGPLAERIVRARWPVSADADVVLEEVPVDALITGARFHGWSGPPWRKEGWFHAYQLLAPSLDAAARDSADATYEHLVRGEALGLAERVNFERDLVAALTAGCARVVVGYAPRTEYLNEAFPPGIENVAVDSLAGLGSPLFVRTVKLKEYPWNGELHVGVPERASAAWNPVAGFSDDLGTLIWSAVGDPALIHFPFNASWMPNRVQATVTRIVGQSGGMRVPADAILPQPGTGALVSVGEHTVSSAKVVYEVLASPFADGSDMEVADLLYPFAFAYRWGSKAADARTAREPQLAEVFTALRERLAGLKVVRIERTQHEVAENLRVEQRTPIVEVYLRNAGGDDEQVTAIAPPWTTVPWHLLALMEEAVARGLAAFSEQEAARRKLPWLDLVRDPAMKARLVDLVAQFEREGFRPDALSRLVGAEEARARWQALRTFVETNGHFLVTNGPYRLKAWSDGSATLQATREISYPLGFGTFDRFVNPPRAVIEAVSQSPREIVVAASAEMTLKSGRGYQTRSEPLTRTTMRGTSNLLVVSRYLLIAPDGTVLQVDKMGWRDDGRFSIALPDRLPPGRYTVVLAVFLDGNTLSPSAKVLHFTVASSGTPG